jgi:hypothetical protein
MVRNGVNRKEIKVFLLEHNGRATGGQAVIRGPGNRRKECFWTGPR